MFRITKLRPGRNVVLHMGKLTILQFGSSLFGRLWLAMLQQPADTEPDGPLRRPSTAVFHVVSNAANLPPQEQIGYSFVGWTWKRILGIRVAALLLFQEIKGQEGIETESRRKITMKKKRGGSKRKTRKLKTKGVKNE